jgi:multicomponent Na+:H+ antiporter subunit F
MTAYLTVIIVLLLLTLLCGLWPIVRGPTAADRMLAAQLFGTLGVAILMLLATLKQQAAVYNAALVLALLAPLVLIAFVKLAEREK